MTSKDLSIFNSLRPFSIGFDDMFDQFENMLGNGNLTMQSNYPPYNIRKTGKDNYAIEVALAGFSKKDVEVYTAKGWSLQEANMKRILQALQDKLSDEGGAAGFDDLKKTAKSMGLNLTPAMLKDMPGIKQHRDGDYILEEIVGDFKDSNKGKGIHKINDRIYLIDGATQIREINKILNWKIPENVAKTINGFILESLENIPTKGVIFDRDGYTYEIIEVSNNFVNNVKVTKK